MGHRLPSGRHAASLSLLLCVYVCVGERGGGVMLVLSGWSLRVALGGPVLLPPLTIHTHMMCTIADIHKQVRPH